MYEFTLPSLGADMDRGKLIEWLVKTGDAVHKGQVVAVVDTSKAAIDVEIWVEGTVFELLATPGEQVPVGAVMATLLAPGEAAPEPSAVPPHRRPSAPETSPGTVAPTPPPTVHRPEPRSHADVAGTRRRVSPAARKHALEVGVDLAEVTGTGPLGAITLADVDLALAAKAPETPRPAADRQELMRQAIAAAMGRSKREIPHYYLSETIAMTRAVDWLTEENARRPITERVLMAAVQLKAVAVALADYPQLNGHVIDGTFRAAPVAHLGVAISLRKGGLVAPALHDVAQKSLTQLMKELSDLVTRARAGSLRSSELTDATITVTNLGDQGVEAVFGIIYPPQVALVGFGRVAPRPWVIDGTVGVSQTVTASLAADHRVSDGHTGAMFLADLNDRLQHPEDLEA